MPTINTGNPGWDQNLSTLGNALFPDPSKAAHAYYYGAEARKAQIEGARLQDQLAAGHTALGMQFGQRPNPQYGPGPLGVTIMKDPNDVGNGIPPQTAIPSFSSAVMGGPTPAPGMPAGGVVPQVLPPAAPGQPVHPAAAVSTLAATAATTPPAALASGIVAGVENNSTTGPGPEATGSDGSRPQNGPGMYHPGSVTSAGGGGVVMAGPAAPDGTPAPISFNFGQLSALMAQSGMSADVIRTVLPATLGNMVKNGQMAQPMAEDLASLMGVPNMRVQTLSNQGSLATANVTAASAANVANINQAGETGRKGMDVTFIPDPNEPTKGYFAPLSKLQGLTPAFNPSAPAVTSATTGVAVQPGGPGTPVIQQPALQAQQQKTPTYQAGPGSAEAAMNEVSDYVDPKKPLQPQRGTLAQAQKNGWVRWPQTAESWQSLAAVAATNAKTPQEGQDIRNKVLTFGQTAMAKPDAANQDFQAQLILDQQLERQFPVPTTGTVMGGSYTSGKNTEPAGASPALEVTFKDLEDQYFRLNPATRGDHVASANAALKQLLQEGYINPDQDRSLSLSGAPTTISKGVLQKDGTVREVPHFRVDLFDPTKIDPKTKKPMQTDGILKVQMPPPMSSTPGLTPAVSGGAPPGALGPAPAGSFEGQTGRTRDGRAVINRGGWNFLMPLP